MNRSLLCMVFFFWKKNRKRNVEQRDNLKDIQYTHIVKIKFCYFTMLNIVLCMAFVGMVNHFSLEMKIYLMWTH